jgi:hypothetical protein
MFPSLIILLLAALSLVGPVAAQEASRSACDGVKVWSTCELVFDLQPGESADSDLHGEFRSPSHTTYLLNAYRDGERRLVIRFAPTEPGAWDYRLTSAIKRLNDATGQFIAAESDAPGFVHAANVHHFATDDKKPHLWMSTPVANFARMPRAEFDAVIAARAAEKFTHLRVTIDDPPEAWEAMREAAGRVRAINEKGMVADIVFGRMPAGAAPNEADARRRYLAAIVPRFAAFNITWAGVPEFEALPQAKATMRDAGQLLARLDPYQHPRTSMARTTSTGLAGDQWMNLFAYGTTDPNVGAVEHQFYQAPAIASGIKNASDLWTATMNGQYPADGSGGYMKAWFEFMSGNRYWELEPYFDVDGGRAVALEDVEYIVYVEKPGPVEVTVEDHGYDVEWMNPLNGERIKAKGYKGKHFTGEPPDKAHPWVLHISREGRKEGMLRSYKFESRRVPVQEVETDAAKTPFDVAAPPEGEIKVGSAPKFALKITRQSRATRSLLVEWTGEVVADGQGSRVLGTGMQGTWTIPLDLALRYPAVLSVRVSVLNANGKAYALDRVYRLTR